MRALILAIALVVIAVVEPLALANCSFNGVLIAPTDPSTTFIRKENGQFGAGRKNGSHLGVDIIVRQSFEDQSAYAVRSIESGVVAYARMNGSIDTGYGNIVIVDHENNCYSAYAHLASDPFSPRKPGDNLRVRVGTRVLAGDLLGYFIRTDADVDSTGNARRTHKAARHQMHFELIEAPSGRTGKGSLGSSIMKTPAMRVNPEPLLERLGLQIE